MDGVWTYSTINLDVQRWELGPQAVNLWHHIFHEFLPYKPMFHCHNQGHIYLIDYPMVSNTCSSWFDSKASLHSILSNVFGQSSWLVCSLQMKGMLIGSCYSHWFYSLFWPGHYHVHVKGRVLA